MQVTETQADGLKRAYKIVISAHPAVCDMLEREERASVEEAARRFQRRIELNPRNDYHLEQFDLTGG